MTFEHKSSDFRAGDRVEVRLATTLWVRRDRYATVTRIGSTRVTVWLDKSNRDVTLHASAILQIIE